MVQNVKRLGGQRYRETFGRCYEDFEVGDVYEHRPGRTITETDNTWFTLLTMNTQLGQCCSYPMALTDCVPSTAGRA